MYLSTGFAVIKLGTVCSGHYWLSPVELASADCYFKTSTQEEILPEDIRAINVGNILNTKVFRNVMPVELPVTPLKAQRDRNVNREHHL